MTAEIAILNREAVALASDSAVTIGEGSKIYNSGNKLFCLSKRYPIGIMIYGNANFMNIPWETIIKIYRSKIKNEPFFTVEDYAKDFIKFLIQNELKITLESQKDFTKFLIIQLLNKIKYYIEKNGNLK
jgi:hypothetical protein